MVRNIILYPIDKNNRFKYLEEYKKFNEGNITWPGTKRQAETDKDYFAFVDKSHNRMEIFKILKIFNKRKYIPEFNVKTYSRCLLLLSEKKLEIPFDMFYKANSIRKIKLRQPIVFPFHIKKVYEYYNKVEKSSPMFVHEYDENNPNHIKTKYVESSNSERNKKNVNDLLTFHFEHIKLDN